MSHSLTSSRSLISRSVTNSPGLLLCSHHYNYSCCGGLSLDCRDFVTQQEDDLSCEGWSPFPDRGITAYAAYRYAICHHSCRDTKRGGRMEEEEGAAWMLLCDFKVYKSSEHHIMKLDMIYWCIARYRMNGKYVYGCIKVRQTSELMSDMRVGLNLGTPGSKCQRCSQSPECHWAVVVCVYTSEWIATTQFYTVWLCLHVADPCHLSSFEQSSGDLIFLWEELVYSVMEKNIYISEFVS